MTLEQTLDIFWLFFKTIGFICLFLAIAAYIGDWCVKQRKGK